MTSISKIGPPRPGELWELPLAGADLLGWVVIKSHPDDAGLLLVVPADGEPEVGPRDLACPLTWSRADGDEVVERCVLRGDFGAWIPAQDLWFRAPGARVSPAWRADFLAGLLRALGAAATGAGGAVATAEAEQHQDTSLGPALAGLEAWRDRASARLRVNLSGPYQLDADLTGGASRVAEPALAYAAAGSDLLDELCADLEDEDPIEPEVLRRLEGGLDGREAVLRMTPSEVQLEVDGAAEPPRCLFLGPSGGRRFLRWTRHLQGGWRSQPSNLRELEAPPLRLVVEGERVFDIELDYESPASWNAGG
ncbi:MAG: hypothetical protein P1V81_16940 [Planctomycetota bacterium]|nr:hypothetical protein [Planctomycetota bacterium]